MKPRLVVCLVMLYHFQKLSSSTCLLPLGLKMFFFFYPKNMKIKTYKTIIFPVVSHWWEIWSVTNIVFFIFMQYVCSIYNYYYHIAQVNLYKTVTATCFVYWEQSSGSLILKTKYKVLKGARGGVVVKAIRYKPAGRGFDSRWCHWNFSVT